MIIVITLVFTDAFVVSLPNAALAAIVMVSVLNLVDLSKTRGGKPGRCTDKIASQIWYCSGLGTG